MLLPDFLDIFVGLLHRLAGFLHGNAMVLLGFFHRRGSQLRRLHAVFFIQGLRLAGGGTRRQQFGVLHYGLEDYAQTQIHQLGIDHQADPGNQGGDRVRADTPDTGADRNFDNVIDLLAVDLDRFLNGNKPDLFFYESVNNLYYLTNTTS